jgi:hypothetical protein
MRARTLFLIYSCENTIVTADRLPSYKSVNIFCSRSCLPDTSFSLSEGISWDLTYILQKKARKLENK